MKHYFASFVGVACFMGFLLGFASLPAQASSVEPTVVATLTVGSGPWGVAITPDSQRAFIGVSGVGTTNNVSVIDLGSRTVIQQVSTGRAGTAGVAVSPDGSFAYFANYNADGNVSKIDTDTYAVTESVRVNADALSIAISPDNQFVYVVCEFGQTWRLPVANLSTTALVASQAGGTFDIAVNATQQVYVGGAPAGRVGIVGDVTNFGALTSSGTAVALSPDGKTAYVGDSGGRLYVFDLAASPWNTLVAMYSLGGDIRGIAITPDGTQAYVTDRNGNTVRVVDLSNGDVLHTIPVGASPQRVAISADGLTAVVTNNASSSVSIISIPPPPVAGETTMWLQLNQLIQLNLDNADGTLCASSVIGRRNTWIALPASSDCTRQTGPADSVLLGWATTPQFPEAIAQRQVDNGWAAYEIYNDDGRIAAVFIPAGSSTYLSASGTLYPIWRN